jgi:hypothetical protein
MTSVSFGCLKYYWKLHKHLEEFRRIVLTLQFCVCYPFLFRVSTDVLEFVTRALRVDPHA